MPIQKQAECEKTLLYIQQLCQVTIFTTANSQVTQLNQKTQLEVHCQPLQYA